MTIAEPPADRGHRRRPPRDDRQPAAHQRRQRAVRARRAWATCRARTSCPKRSAPPPIWTARCRWATARFLRRAAGSRPDAGRGRPARRATRRSGRWRQRLSRRAARPLVGSLDVDRPAEAAVRQAGKRRRLTLLLIDGAIEAIARCAGRTAGRRRAGGHRPGRARRDPARGRPQGGGDVALLPLAEIGIPVLPAFAAPKALELLTMTRQGRLSRWRCIAGAVALAAAAPAHADTLKEALTGAYQHQPDARGRARQPARDRRKRADRQGRRAAVAQRHRHLHRIRQAELRLASSRPTASLGGQAQPRRCRSIRAARSGTASRPPKTRVEAGQADLRATESSLFSQVVAAYMDVILQRGDRRPATEQRRRAQRQSAGDQRPVRDRRPHPHRRRAVAIAAGAGAGRPAHRASQSDRGARDLHPAGRPGARRSAAAAAAARPARQRRPKRVADRAGEQSRPDRRAANAPRPPATTSTSPARAACRKLELFTTAATTTITSARSARAGRRRPSPAVSDHRRRPACG